MSKHSNISVFVPHIGCAHQCSFCNQRYITGHSGVPSIADIDNAVSIAVSSSGYDKATGQLAFFGGSFTAIDRALMISLLQAAKRHIDNGSIASIRISTRPDAIDNEILDILRRFGVRSVELGAQSMVDSVLLANERGHTVQDVIDASRLIKSYGFELGLQMMTGLYRSDDECDLLTAQRIIELRPDTVRIYPTLVLEKTRLCELYRKGEYTPQTVLQATSLGAKLLYRFYNENIRVIRFGLHTVEMEHFVAGPWHPSLAELAYSELYFRAAVKQLSHPGSYTLYVKSSEISKMIGNKRNNLEKLAKMGYNCIVKADDSIGIYEVKAGEE